MTQNRDTLKDYFKKNAIPTEGNFAELIDSQLNQFEDGIFKPTNEPLSLRPSGALPALRLHPSNDIAATGHWSLYLTAPAFGTKPHLNIADNDGNTHLFLDAFNRFVGLGTTTPSVKLDVAGKVNASGGVEASTGFSVPKAVVGYAWSSLASATADLSVSGAVGVGTTAPGAGVKLDVVGKIKASGGLEAGTGVSATKAVVGYSWNSVASATADLSVAGSIGVGTISPAAGAKLDVVGKIYTSGGLEAGTGISTNKVVIGWTWNSVASATADLSVLGSVGVGTFTPAVGVKLDVNGKVNASGGLEASTGISATKAVIGYAWSSVASATADLSVAGSLGVGTTTPGVGVKLDVNGKLRATDATVTGYTTSGTLGVGVASNAGSMALHVAGNGCVTDYLAVGSSTIYGGVKLHVAGSTIIQGPSSTSVYVRSDTAGVGLYMLPASDSYAANIILYTDSSGSRGVNMYNQKTTVNGVETNRLALSSVGAQPFQLFTFGGAHVQGDLTTTGVLTIGSWTLSVISNNLIISYLSTKVAGLSASGSNRLEVRSNGSNYFVVRNDATFAMVNSTTMLS